MKKRHFLAAVAGGAALPTVASAQGAKAAQGPALLTVTGAIAKTNRGPFDPVLDVLMVKQKLAFDKARTFGFAELAAMTAVTIKPTLEYDSKRHELKGPLLTTVLQACGATGSKLAMRAVDGYAPVLSVADARKYGYIVATHLDGRPMPLGGLGPLWAVFEPDRFPEAAAKPVDQRFAGCPWALFHIDVQA